MRCQFLIIFLFFHLSQFSHATETITKYSYLIVATFPHDHTAFTQGFAYANGFFYESTGRRTESSLRQVDIETGAVIRSVSLAADFFGEGLTVLDQKLIQLTWQSYTGLIYSLENLSLQQEFYYTTEGWGLTNDGNRLIMSDGSAQIYFLDPANYAIIKTIAVHDTTGPVRNINELEFVNGEIYANIMPSNRIACINPKTGKIRAWIDLSDILQSVKVSSGVDVLNGIAYDSESDRLFITGKLWPVVFEIKLIPIK
jgi:glutamine cyclotransferase